MQTEPYAKFSVSLRISQLKFLKKLSGQQYNRPISQLIAEAVELMQKGEIKKAAKAKAAK